jgi:hypothetical protein
VRVYVRDADPSGAVCVHSKLASYPGLTSFEAAQLCNLLPESVDEAVEVIPRCVSLWEQQRERERQGGLACMCVSVHP